jgi:hypothetical protein
MCNIAALLLIIDEMCDLLVRDLIIRNVSDIGLHKVQVLDMCEIIKCCIKSTQDRLHYTTDLESYCDYSYLNS